jgi:DNA (cytosine-5)-methyltransferase 1
VAGGSQPYRVLSLFAGIGGFDLGLERTGGFKTVAFCEIEPYACEVLAKRWPGVPNLGDVTTAEFPNADVICAGFPCQDISNAGKRAGITGSRSGLWREVVRAIRMVRPRYVLLENVAALLDRGMGRVLGDLAEVGLDTEWDCIPASYVGAWHQRDRVWILAYSDNKRLQGCGAVTILRQSDLSRESVGGFAEWPGRSGLPESRLSRSLHGLPGGVDRVRALGNAIVPQVAELIGRAILASREAA